jgi:cytochrome c553
MRGISLVVTVGLALAAASPTAGQQTDPNLGRAVAATCANCHGTSGVSVGEVPSLAGRPKDELIRKMQDFKTGRTQGTIMPQLAKGYTDEQIDVVAAWYAARPAK